MNHRSLLNIGLGVRGKRVINQEDKGYSLFCKFFGNLESKLTHELPVETSYYGT